MDGWIYGEIDYDMDRLFDVRLDGRMNKYSLLSEQLYFYTKSVDYCIVVVE